MKREIKPDFYDSFQCIAGDCDITCCQEWKIAVDEDTFSKWEKTTLDQKLCEEIGTDKLTDLVTKKEGGRVIGLKEDHKCPFLNKNKLCKLVIGLGDQALSETCTLFPRQIHEFEDRVEYSVVACCPEVVDIINRKDKITFVEQLMDENESELDAENEKAQDKKAQDEKAQDLSKNLQDFEVTDQEFLTEIRSLMISMIEDTNYTVSKALKMSFYVLLDILEKAGQPNRSMRRAAKGKKNSSEKDQLGINYKTISLEAYQKDGLRELSEALDQMAQDELDTFDERNELFLDLAENYRKEGLYTRYLDPIAELAEQLTEEYDADEITDKIATFKKEFSQYEALLRKYLVVELFADFVLPESNLQDLVVAMQWIGMEYATIRQTIFLHWMQTGEKELDYRSVRDYLVVVARMTGYDAEDIVEYLENSFQNLIWDWGYFALIV